MPRIVVTHAVEDVARWLEGKAERAAAVEGLSGSNVSDYVAEDGSNNVAISCDVSDLAAMQAELESPSPEVAEPMQKHGVIPPLTVYVQA